MKQFLSTHEWIQVHVHLMNHQTLSFQPSLELWVPSYIGYTVGLKILQKNMITPFTKKKQTKHHQSGMAWNQRQASMTQLNELPFTKPWIPGGHIIGFKSNGSLIIKVEKDGCFWKSRLRWPVGLQVILESKPANSNWILLFPYSSRKIGKNFNRF